MKTSRIVALIIGCLLLLPGLGLLFGGGALGLAYATARNESGYFQSRLTNLQTPTEAITAQTPTLTTDLKTSTWLIDALDTDLRLRVTAASGDAQTFIGIGPAADVDAYLRGVAHDEIVGLTNGMPVYRASTGNSTVAAPTDQNFWIATTAGVGTQQLSWHPTDGRWAVVIMNADGSPGIAAAGTVEVRAGFLLPLAVILFVLGVLISAGAVVLIVIAMGWRSTGSNQGWSPGSGGALALGQTGAATREHPVVLTANLDPDLSRWRWLVKWFLAIPHYVVLAFLWPAFLVVTVIAGFAILFTGRYPRPLFDFTSGVLRWTWRVSYYAASGGLGTDLYPPFTLGPAAHYPAVLDIAYPQGLSRGLVLVKWWLLALPHYLIVGLFVTNWWGWTSTGERFAFGPVGSGGLLGLLVVIAAVILLITAKYPKELFALIVGLNRWIYRVVAYAALMTDQYPPFRLDQGGSEPAAPPPVLPTAGPADPRVPEPVDTRTA
ncbi:MAG: DUF4389 domain-containing protein [Antricoccus sp.]